MAGSMDLSLRISVAQTGLGNITQLISQLQAAGQDTSAFEQQAEQLRQELQQLGQQQAAIESFKRLKQSVADSETALQQAQQQAQALGRAYSQLAAPTAAQTRELQRARNAVRAAAAAHQANVQALQNQRAAMQQAGLSTTNLAQHQINLNRAVQAAQQSQQRLQQQLQQTAQAAQHNAAQAQRASQAWSGLQSGLAVGVGFAAAQAGLESISGAFNTLKRGIEAVITTGAIFETLKVQLETLYQSSEKADQAFQWIQNFTASTPFEMEQVTQSFIKLKAMGMDPMDGSFQAIADQASALGAKGETLGGIVLALGQAWSKQKLQGEEALQLIERGVPVWELLQEATGKTAVELQSMSEKGLLGRDAIKALMNEMGRANMGAAEKAMQTFNGQLASLSDNWTAFLSKIADAGALDFFKTQIEDINAAIAEMRANGKLDEYARAASDAIVFIGQALRDGVLFVAEYADALMMLGQVALGLKLTGAVSEIANIGVQSALSGQQAANAAGLIQKSFALMQAAIVGWSIGSYLTGQFLEVELAGIALAKGLTDMAARAKYAWDVLNAPSSNDGIFGAKTHAEIKRLTQELDVELVKIRDSYDDLAASAQAARDPAAKAPKAATAEASKLNDALALAIEAEQKLADDATAAARRIETDLGDAFKALGLDINASLGRISPEVNQGLDALQALKEGLGKIGTGGAQKIKIIEQAIANMIDKAKSSADIAVIAGHIDELGKSGAGAGASVGRLAAQLDEQKIKLDQTIPGLNSLKEAYSQFGIKSVASMQQAAVAAEGLYKMTVANKAPLFEQQQAFERMAKAQLEAASTQGQAAMQAKINALAAIAQTEEQRATVAKLQAEYSKSATIAPPDNTQAVQSIQQVASTFDALMGKINNAPTQTALAEAGDKIKQSFNDGLISSEEYGQAMQALNDKMQTLRIEIHQAATYLDGMTASAKKATAQIWEQSTLTREIAGNMRDMLAQVQEGSWDSATAGIERNIIALEAQAESARKAADEWRQQIDIMSRVGGADYISAVTAQAKMSEIMAEQAAEVERAKLAQERLTQAMDGVKAAADSGNLTLGQQRDRLIDLQNQFGHLDGASLNRLRGEIDSINDRLLAMQQQAESTLISLRQEEARARGDDVTALRIAGAEKIKKLEQELAEVQKAGNDEAARSLQEALSIQQRLNDAALVEAQTRKKAADENERTAKSNSSSSNGGTTSPATTAAATTIDTKAITDAIRSTQAGTPSIAVYLDSKQIAAQVRTTIKDADRRGLN